MIEGVGVDLIKTSRIEGVLERWSHKFLGRIFSPEELKDMRGPREEGIAARWAAKEALFKAIDPIAKGCRFKWREVEILNTDTGKPYFKLKGPLAGFAARRKWRLHLSLSHDRGRAVAVVVLERHPRSGAEARGFKSRRR